MFTLKLLNVKLIFSQNIDQIKKEILLKVSNAENFTRKLLHKLID